MLIRSWASTVSLLLILVLTVASLVPPGIRHLHPIVEGEGGHHHHGVEASDSRSDHRDSHDFDIAQLDDAHWHLHFHVLGYEITLPEPKPSEDRDDSQAGVEWVILAANVQPFCGRIVESSTLDQLCVASPLVCGNSEAVNSEAKEPAPPPVVSARLCDRARRERSGVLRA